MKEMVKPLLRRYGHPLDQRELSIDLVLKPVKAFPALEMKQPGG